MSEPAIAALAFAIAEELAQRSVLYLCDDEQQAQALAAALSALAPAAPVVFLPASDALPGDVAPPSPGNVGHRTAALRALRRHTAEQPGRPLACILSGEAAGQRYAAPEDYDSAPPVLAVGDLVDAEGFATLLAEIGYVADDRVDEPGEVAVRGEVIDIFPADADHPARLDLAAGRIAAIRDYEPVSQRSLGARDRLEIGRATEPTASGHTSVLAHLVPGAIGMSLQADARRRRFFALAKDAARRGGKPLDAADEAAWQAELKAWAAADLPRTDIQPLPRFAERRSPLAACAKALNPLVADGRPLLLVGSARDLRFVRPRLEKRLGLSFAACAGWAEIEKLGKGAAATLEMPVDRGFVDDARIVLAAGDLLGSRALICAPGEAPAPSLAAGSESLRIGDVVVHEDHGVGRVAGLEPAPGFDGAEMIALDHAGGNRRLIAPHEASRLWRYGSDGEAVMLDRLDGRSWRKPA